MWIRGMVAFAYLDHMKSSCTEFPLSLTHSFMYFYFVIQLEFTVFLEQLEFTVDDLVLGHLPSLPSRCGCFGLYGIIIVVVDEDVVTKVMDNLRPSSTVSNIFFTNLVIYLLSK